MGPARTLSGDAPVSKGVLQNSPSPTQWLRCAYSVSQAVMCPYKRHMLAIRPGCCLAYEAVLVQHVLAFALPLIDILSQSCQ